MQRLVLPGQGPFHAKGLVYRGARSFYDLKVPGGAAALRDHLSPALATFFYEERFVPGSWYDILPIVPISEVAAGLWGVTHAQLVRENAAWVARRDIHGVYRFLLKLASPSIVAQREVGIGVPGCRQGGGLCGHGDGRLAQHDLRRPLRIRVRARGPSELVAGALSQDQAD